MKKIIPVKVNDIVELKITDLSHDGLGIAKLDGFLIFVSNALPEEIVKAKITTVKKKYGHGKSILRVKSSILRVEPPCDIFSICGGCQLQHLSYEGQLVFKRNMVIKNLKKFGHIEDAEVLDVIGMTDPWRYRNKTQVPFGRNEEGDVVAGFYKSRTHYIIDMPKCIVQSTDADKIIDFMRQLVANFGIKTYNDISNTGDLRHIVIKKGFNSGELMVILISRTEILPHKEQICDALTQKFPHIKSIAHNINPNITNVIFGDVTKIIYGKNYIADTLDGLSFMISPRSFYQVNPVQTEILYQKAIEFAQIKPTDVVFDAYCGIGTITLYLAKVAKEVYGVEIVEDAINDARKNATLNGINNAFFEVGKSEIVIPRLITEGIVPDVIVVDPPRKGCDPILLETIINAKPERVVYVSCDSATLARDLAILASGGFVLDVVQPVDMFPHTSHVECVALMSRKK